MTKRYFDQITVDILEANGVTVVEVTTPSPLEESGERTFTGTARLHLGDDRGPGDVNNFDIGYTLALSRALIAAGNRLARQADGLVKCLDDNAKHSIEAKDRPRPAVVKPRVKAAESTAATSA